MSIRRNLVLAAGAVALTVGGIAVAHKTATAGAAPLVVERFLLGYFDRKGKFIPTAGRGATNVDRNAICMFVFSGPVDSGPNTRATLSLTLKENAELQEKIQSDPDYDPTQDGYEPGVIPRRRSEDPAAFLVAGGSVNLANFNFGAPSAAGFTDPPGVFFKVLKPGSFTRIVPNRVIFNPRYVSATYNRPGEIDYNPEGFEAGTTYQLFLDGGANPSDPIQLVRNLDGDGLSEAFGTTFTTGNRYVQDFSRPQVRETAPTDLSVNVAYDADVDLTFSEPMDVASFQLPKFQGDDTWTMQVKFDDDVSVNGSLAGRNVLGVVRVKPQTAGNVIQFRPLQGFGKGPYKINVTVTNGVTDLSGNNIIRQVNFSFRTESNPNAEDFNTVDERFDNTTKRDATFTPSGDFLQADWNPTFARGRLTTTVQEASFDARSTGTASGINIWFATGIHMQMFLPEALTGQRARTLTGWSWNLSGALSGLTYTNTSVLIGQPNDATVSTGLPPGALNTVFVTTPTTVTSAVSYRPANPSGGYVRGPSWSRNWNYDGSRGIILDITTAGNGTTGTYDYWFCDRAFSQNVNSNAAPINPQQTTWLFFTRFHYLTPGAEAQSTFYDIGRSNARLQPQQLLPVTQPSGTDVSLVWQGAKDSLTTPGVPDTSTLTNWVADIRQLSNYRFIRFRATLLNNLTNATAPSLDTITVPYTYR